MRAAWTQHSTLFEGFKADGGCSRGAFSACGAVLILPIACRLGRRHGCQQLMQAALPGRRLCHTLLDDQAYALLLLHCSQSTLAMSPSPPCQHNLVGRANLGQLALKQEWWCGRELTALAHRLGAFSTAAVYPLPKML